jgi:release factor glutamine methyltransferase
MTLNDFLTTTTKRLSKAGIATARLDCLVLLEDILNTNRTQILAHPDRTLTELEHQILTAMITKRARHIPLAYIRGKTEFYGREFTITEHVLEPRPESETMIDLLKSLPTESHTTIIDVGTGSGALAVTAKLELPSATVIATDIDPRCLQLAQANATKLKTDITCLRGNLLGALPATQRPKSAILLCNLPYVPNDFHINIAASHEPRLAIFGGPDGLDLFRLLFTQLENILPGKTIVLCESLPPQHTQLSKIAEAAAFRLITTQDFIQVFQRI